MDWKLDVISNSKYCQEFRQFVSFSHTNTFILCVRFIHIENLIERDRANHAKKREIEREWRY